MNKRSKTSEPVGLRREPDRRRRFPWWVIPLVVFVVVLLAGALWLFRPRLERALQRPPTLPPPPPTRPAEAGSEGLPEGVLYAADFDDPAQAADWEIFDDGIISAQVADGRLVVGVLSVRDDGTWSGLNYTFDDFVLEVDAVKLGGPDDNGISIVFRLTDTGSYNRFDISSDGYYALSAVRNGVPRVVSSWNASPAIRQGAEINRIRVTAVGDTFTFAVNDQVLDLCVSDAAGVQPVWDTATGGCLGGERTATWVNGDLPRGKIGLGAQGFVGFDGEETTLAEAVIGFDNLIIRAP